VESGFEMVKKMELIDDLLTISILIVVDYTLYHGIALYSSPNFFKDLQGSWLIFLALSGTDFLILEALYYEPKKGTQRHGMVRSLKARAIIKYINGFTAHMLTPLVIVLTALMTIYFLAVFITSAIMLTLTKSLTLYTIFITTVLMYIMVMYYGIEAWHYKRAHKPISTP